METRKLVITNAIVTGLILCFLIYDKVPWKNILNFSFKQQRSSSVEPAPENVEKEIEIEKKVIRNFLPKEIVMQGFSMEDSIVQVDGLKNNGDLMSGFEMIREKYNFSLNPIEVVAKKQNGETYTILVK